MQLRDQLESTNQRVGAQSEAECTEELASPLPTSFLTQEELQHKREESLISKKIKQKA